MKKILIALCFIPFTLSAQNFHFAARVGVINYQGDLQAKKITFNQAKFFGSLGANYDLTEHITARTYFTLGALQGDDKKGTNSMRARNLSFGSSLFDWELSAQYNILSLNDHWFTPYLFAGVGLFHFKPYTTFNNNKTYLQPLGTEGQGMAGGPKPYKLTQFNIPLGLGALYAVNEDIRVGLELSYRKTFTDYIDDVSGEYADEAALLAGRGQTAVDLAYRGNEVGSGPYPAAKTSRGNPKLKDAYYFVGLTVTVRSFIDQYKRIAGLPTYKRNKKVGCPATRF